MASRKSGGIRWNISVNAAGASSQISLLKQKVRELNHEWRNEYQSLMAAGRYQEAMRVKVKGLSRVYNTLGENIHKANTMLNNSSGEAGSRKYEKLRITVKGFNDQQTRAVRYMKNVRRQMILNNKEMQDASEITRTHEQVGNELIQQYRNEGNSIEVARQRMDNYKEHLSDLDRQEKILLDTKQRARAAGENNYNNPRFARIVSQLRQVQNAEQTTRNEMENVTAGVVKNTMKLNELDQKIQYNRQLNNELAQTYRNEGDSVDEVKAKIAGYADTLAGLNQKEKQLKSTISSQRIANKQGVNNTANIRANILELQKLRMANAQTKRSYQDLNSGLVTGAKYNRYYNQSTEKVVNWLKSVRGEAEAGRYEYKRLTTNINAEQTALDRERTKLAQVAEANESDNDATGHLSVAYAREQSKMESLNAAYQRHLVKISELRNSYGRMTQTAARQSDNLATRIHNLDNSSHYYLRTAHALTNGSIALGAAFIYGVKQSMGLENQFNRVRNLLNTSGESYRQSTNEINQMSKATANYSMEYGVSQQQISKGYEALVRRGYSGNQALASQKSYLQGAIASGDKYSDVMDTAASTLEAFGLRSNHTNRMVGNTKTVVNQLAYAADLTATDMKGIGYGMKFVGATAHSANQSVSETSSALGVLSNNGQNATNAGFGLRKVLNSFIAAKDTKAWKKILPQLGLSPKDFQDAEGHFKKLSTMMAILQSHLKGKSDAEKTDIFHQLFGATGQESALILARSTHQLSNLNGQVAKSQQQDKGRGYAARIARKNMNSTQMQMKRLQMAGTELAKNYAQGLNPAFKRLATVSLDVAGVFHEMPKPFKDLVAISTTAIPVLAAFGYTMATVKKATSAWTMARRYGLRYFTESDEALMNNQSAVTRHTQELQNNTDAQNDNNAAKQRGNELDNQNSADVTNDTRAEGANTTALTSADRAEQEGSITSSAGELSKGATVASHVPVRSSLLAGGLVGGTEAASGDRKGGLEDGIGTAGGMAGGAALGAVVPTLLGAPELAGAGSKIGGTIGMVAGPMLARSVGKAGSKINWYNQKSLQRVPQGNSTDRTNTKNLNNDLKGISASSQQFVKSESQLENKATEQIAENGGKVGKNTLNNYNKMYSLAQSYGNKELKAKDGYLSKLHKQGLLNNSQYQKALTNASSSEKKSLSNIQRIHQRLITSDTKTDKADVRQRGKDLRSLNTYMLKLTNAGYKRMGKLRKDLLRSDSKLTEREYGHVQKLRKRDCRSAINSAKRTYRSRVKSVKNELNTLKHGNKSQRSLYRQARKNAYNGKNGILKQYRDQRNRSIKGARNESRKVNKATNDRVSNSVRKAYEHKRKVEANNRRIEAENERHRRNVRRYWHNEIAQGNDAVKDLGSRIMDVFGFIGKGVTQIGDVTDKALGAIGKGLGSAGHNTAKWSGEAYRKVKSWFANGTPDTATLNANALHLANGNLNGIPKTEMAVVNDGGGRELIRLPNGQLVLPSGDNVHTVLPKGTSVFNANQTRHLIGSEPAIHHAAGTVGSLGRTKGKAVSVKTPSGGLEKTEKDTKKSMKNIHDLINSGYKKTNKDSAKTLKDMHDKTNDKWVNTGKLTKKQVKAIYDDTTGRFSDMKDALNDMQKKSNSSTYDHLDTMTTYFKHHFSIIPPLTRSSMSSGISNINSGISAIDSVLSQFGGNSHVLGAAHYAGGTSGPSMNQQLAILNDATGGPTQEAVVSDQGRVRMPRGRNVLTTLNPGDKVLNGADTLRALRTGLIPHYAGGKQSDDALKNLAKNYAKAPTTFTNNTFNKFASIIGDVLSKGMTQATKNGAQHPANSWSNAMWKYIDTLINPDNSILVRVMHELGDGKKYRLGSTGPDAYDCGSLVHAALARLGISSGTNAPMIMHDFKRIPRDEAGPGDIVGNNSHVGVVDSQGAKTYFSAFNTHAHPNILTNPCTPEYFDGNPIWFERPKGLDSDNAEVQEVKANPLTALVKKQLGTKASDWIGSNLGSSAGEVGGSGAIARAWNEFSKLGLDKNQIMAVIGGAQQESHFDPNVIAGDGGQGMFQATPPYGNVIAYAHRNGMNWHDPAVQARYYYLHWLEPSGFLSTHGSLSSEAMHAAEVEASSSAYGGLSNDSNFENRLAGAHTVENWYNNHKGSSHYANGGLSVGSKLASISEGNKPEMVLPLTNRTRAVELMFKSLQYMFGNNRDRQDHNEAGNDQASNEQTYRDYRFEQELMQSNRNKDVLINKILGKMTVLIQAVENKPVISSTDIYHSFKNVQMNKLRLRNYNRGTF